MMWHYFITAIRSLRHQSVVTVFGILGLALGLAGFIVAYSVVRYLETSEAHFSKADRIYLVSTDLTFPGEQRPLRTLLTVAHAAKYFEQEFPDLEGVVRVVDWEGTAIATPANKINVRGVAADSQFLSAFDLEFVAGNSVTAMAGPRSIILTDATAISLFGSRDVIGMPIRIDGLIDATVTGVIRPLPGSSIFDFEMLASWDVHEAILAARRPPTAGPPPELHWLGFNTAMYVVLPQKNLERSREVFLGGIAGFAKKYIPANQLTYYDATFSAIALSSLNTARLDQAMFSNVAEGISITWVLFLLGVFILGLATINYANLEIAQAAARYKEAATRRVVGATLHDLVVQQWSRTAIHSVVALTAAMILVLGAAPIIDRALDVEIRRVVLADGMLWTLTLLSLLLAGVIAGGYVALAAVRVTPGRAVKSPAMAASSTGRAVMVGGQFAAASLLLVVLMVVDQQAQMLRSRALAPQQQSVVLVGNDLRDARVAFAVYKNSLSTISGVQAVSAMQSRPWAEPRINSFSHAPSSESPRSSVTFYGIERDFFRTLGIPLLAGRVLDPGFGSDFLAPGQPRNEAAGPLSMMVDRALAESMGFKDPVAAVGQLLYEPGAEEGSWEPVRIVGVVENRPLSVASDGSQGNIFALVPRPSIPVLKISTRDLPATLDEIGRSWNELAPDIPLDVRVVDAVFDQGYRPFQMLFHFVSGLMLLAISISLAGLVAMAVHESNRRFHEIAVRKTLGAPAATIAADLLKKFSIPVLAGNLVALPLAYFVANAYLSLFTLRIDLSVWPFLWAVAITLSIGWFAVGFQILRTARLNPASVLRYELPRQLNPRLSP